MREKKERTLRDDLEIVRDALIDAGSIAQMKDWRTWVAAAALVALASAAILWLWVVPAMDAALAAVQGAVA